MRRALKRAHIAAKRRPGCAARARSWHCARQTYTNYFQRRNGAKGPRIERARSVGVQGGWGCAARAQTQRAERAEIAHLTSSRELCAAPRRSSLELVDGGQLPDSGSSLRRPYMSISGRELHICASRPTRDAKSSRCAAMFEGMGHERGAHQRWSARSGAALDRDVQVVRHRALRLQSRLAPDDDADACALTRSEAGRRSNGPSVPPGVGKEMGPSRLHLSFFCWASEGDQRKPGSTPQGDGHTRGESSLTRATFRR